MALNVVCFRYLPRGFPSSGSTTSAITTTATPESEWVESDSRLIVTPTGVDNTDPMYGGATVSVNTAKAVLNIDTINNNIVLDLHEQGIVVPSVTKIHSVTAIRVGLINHRTQQCDMDKLITNVLLFGGQHDIL